MLVQKEDFGGTADGQRGWKTEIERREEEMEVLLMVDSKGRLVTCSRWRQSLKHHHQNCYFLTKCSDGWLYIQWFLLSSLATTN